MLLKWAYLVNGTVKGIINKLGTYGGIQAFILNPNEAQSDFYKSSKSILKSVHFCTILGIFKEHPGGLKLSV